MKPAGLLGAFAVMAVAWTEAIAVNPADYGHSPTGANAQIIPWVANFFAREWTKRLAEAPVGSGSRLENLGVTLGGGFQFAFSNVAGATFTVLASTNVGLPSSNWAILGSMTESPVGNYHFSGGAANDSFHFYKVRSP